MGVLTAKAGCRPDSMLVWGVAGRDVCSGGIEAECRGDTMAMGPEITFA